MRKHGRKLRATCRLEPLEVRRVLDSTVVFNELQYNPGDDQDLEWIELHSQMAVDMDLSGWRIDGVDYLFPEDTIVSAGNYVVIAKSPTAFQAATGISGALGPYAGQLANGGETVRLIDNSDRVMDEIDYNDNPPWPVGPDGSGATLSKIDSGGATEPVQNWTTSDAIGGTPAAANFSFSTGSPPSTHLQFNATWRYDDSDTDWSDVWLSADFDPNDPNGDANTSDAWSSGTGLFASGVLSMPEPVETTINFGPTTHYFRTEFEFKDTFENRYFWLNSVIDDGAVFYLNGQEVARINLPDGPINHHTEANVSVSTAAFSGPIPIPIENLVIGTNVLSVELHQSAGNSQGNRSIVGTISPEPGFSITWDGNDGAFFDSADRVLVPVNLATSTQATTTAGSSQAGNLYLLSNINDGRYGDSFSWLPRASDPSPYAILSFNETVGISSIAFGRDNGRSNPPVSDEACGLQCTDRSTGTYTFQFTRIPNPSFFTQVTENASTGWETIGELTYTGSADDDVGGDFTSYLRHEYAVSKNAQPIQANHLRIKLSSSSMAIDEVEVYGAAEDAAFGAEVTSQLVLPEPANLVINETASGNDASFFLEITNQGEETTDLADTQIVSSATGSSPYILPSQILAPDDYLQITEAQLGFDVNPGDMIFFYSQAQVTLMDAVRVDDVLRGRSDQLNGQWVFPDVATPGAPNSFAFEQDVVINEIMFHHQRLSGDSSDSVDTPLVAIDASTQWRYNETGQDLGGFWELSSHTVDSVNWFQGPAPLGFESATLPEVIRTQLTDPSTNSPLVNTYYFETDFTFSGNPQDFNQLQIRHMIDDGAVFYLNGAELLRHNMPGNVGDAVQASESASSTVDNATFVGPTSVSADALVTGLNRLSVEVHQSGSASSDIAMAVELTARSGIISPENSGSIYFPVSEEWFELYNRNATQSIDLTGWSVAGGIDFDFPAGATIGPQDYLVVANDADELRSKFPSVSDKIIGNFSGRLSNQDELIQLLDARQNPADQVHYFEGGRWAEYADGGGSTLELRDPFADNRQPESWEASDETVRSSWQYYSYTATTSQPLNSGPNTFIMGLLDSGEMLLDDLSVIERPSTSNTERISNGSFQSDTVGWVPSGWKIGGTQSGVVAIDPEDPDNKVLHLTATGPLGDWVNDAETILSSSKSSNVEFQISFRAKWLGGSNQLNTHLYYNRIPQTTLVTVPAQSGTPAAQNTALESNIGPTYDELLHWPAVPDISESVTVSVQAEDPQGIAGMELYFSIDEGLFQTSGMSDVGNGQFQGTIPGQSSSTVVQFYVQGTDSLGAVSTFPAAGADSRALFKVQDGKAKSGGIHNFRIVMAESDENDLFIGTNSFLDERAMTNRRLGATVIYNENEVFYDARIRLKGSNVGRTETISGIQFLSFNIAFDPMQKFRGVHRSVAIDRSGRGKSRGLQSEILSKHIANHAGEIPYGYDDLVHVISPRSQFDRTALLMMARYGDVYLDSQYENGSDGTVFKKESFGENTGEFHRNPDMQDLGDDKEFYRPYMMIRNNRAADDYSGIIAAAQVLDLSGSALEAAAPDVIDVDQWARVFTILSLTGVGDGYTQHPTHHNIKFYAPPGDGKLLAFPWDWDWNFSNPYTGPLIGGGEYDVNNTSNTSKLLKLPTVLRLVHGHMLDIINTTFNATYLNPWIDHYSAVARQNWGSIKSFVSGRGSYVLNKLPPQIPFKIESNDGNDFSVNDTTVTLDGQGWIDVREIRLTGTTAPLKMHWLDGENWKLTLPIHFGSNLFSLEAYDHQGELVGSDSITVTSTATVPSLQESIRITELNYNPHDPMAAELAVDPTLVNDDFEFIELQNIGSATMNLTNATFTNGIDFSFGSAQLMAGQRGVIVKNMAGFQLRYGSGINVIGQFNSGSLSGQGERLTLVDGASEVILDFVYDDGDPWPERPDGHGATLELVDPIDTKTDQYEKYYNWRGSSELGGSPGAAGQEPVGVVINEVLSQTNSPGDKSDSIELLNTTASPIDISGWYLSDSSNNFLKYMIPNGTLLGAGQYIVFDENDFNPTPLNPSPNDFALSGTSGDDVWLVDPNGEAKLVFVDDVHFRASSDREALGRVPDGSGRLAPLEFVTLGGANSDARVGSVVISEVNYHPDEPTAVDLALEPSLKINDLEFIEIYNRTAQSVDLTDWRLRGEVDYDFVAGTTLSANHVLTVVSFNPSSAENANRAAAFRLHYGIDSNVILVGGYQSQLNDGSARITLERALIPPVENPTLVAHGLEDEVVYDDQAPWPMSQPGENSIHRELAASYGNDATNWSADSATPGSFPGSLWGDFNGDLLVNATDIDLLMSAVHAGSHNTNFDLTGDLQLTSADTDQLVQVILMTDYGDTDLDRDVDTGDLTQAIINFTGAGGAGKTWSSGDGDGDGDVDTGDLTQAIINFTGARAGSLVSQGHLPVGIVAQTQAWEVEKPEDIQVFTAKLSMDTLQEPDDLPSDNKKVSHQAAGDIDNRSGMNGSRGVRKTPTDGIDGALRNMFRGK